MSRDFSKNLANYMSLGANAIGPLINGAAQISFHCWAYSDTLDDQTLGNVLLQVRINAATVGIRVAIGDGGGLYPVAISARAAAAETQRNIFGLTDVTTGTYHSIGVLFNFANDLVTIYLDGVADGPAQAAAFTSTNYTNGTPTSADSIGTTVVPANSTLTQFDGRIAEVAVWNDDIGADNFSLLAAGQLASAVQTSSLAYYHPLNSGPVTGPDVSLVGSISGTITGSVPFGDVPPIIIAHDGGTPHSFSHAGPHQYSSGPIRVSSGPMRRR